MSPHRLREYVLVVTRDIMPPTVATFLAFYLPLAGQFAAWQAPLLATLFGVPFFAPRSNEAP